MKKLLVVALGLLMVAPAFANQMQFSFRPNDMLDLYPAGTNNNDTWSVLPDQYNPANGSDARRLRSTGNGTLDTYSTDNAYNAYLNWRDGLGANEGIRQFTIWLAPGWTYTTYFGDTLTTKPHVTDTGLPVTGPFSFNTGASGWTGQFVPTQSEVGNGWPYGGIIQFRTEDLSKAIRPGGVDLGTWTLDGDWQVCVSDTWTYASDVVYGTAYRMFFWADSYNSGAASDPDLIFDASGWGTRTTDVTPFSNTTYPNAPEQAFYAAYSLVALPEPSTFLFIGVMGAAYMIRRRIQR